MATVATTVPSQHSDRTPTQHNYGTRIRSNSVMRPSVRLRQSPGPPAPPRRIRPGPSKLKAVTTASESPQMTLPPFPPSHVMLHEDDANSKVFLAIGRSFMSVDNRAMTIKDLAEMTMKFGLICQNVSAAGQAITTYIRNHLQRCEAQQDHPLLLRHTMSGTPSDDDLVPALHSRVGGAHCTVNAEGRVTNFRRGTMVWYLSKAAGAPCPFTRAGIQLSDYTEKGKLGCTNDPAKERKRERDRLRRAQQCGQKRKRLTRACADKGKDSDSSEEERRPPKVKLTLRLRPSLAPCRSSGSPTPQTSSSSATAHSPEVIDLSHNDDPDTESDSDSMSVDSSDSDSSESSDDSSWESSAARTASPSDDVSTMRPEVPDISRYSSSPCRDASASPPPDSEVEEDDYDMDTADNRYLASDSYDEDDVDWQSDYWNDFDEIETQWEESPGPRSPSAHFDDDQVTVKQEPRDVQSLLESWDEIDITATDVKVVDVVAQAAAGLGTSSTHPLKVEQDDSWDLGAFGQTESSYFPVGVGEYLAIKQEEEESSLPFQLLEPMENICQSPLSPSPSSTAVSSPRDYWAESAIECRRPSVCVWQDAEILGPDSVKPIELEEGMWHSSKKPYPEPQRPRSPVHATSSEGHVSADAARQEPSHNTASSSSLASQSHATTSSPSFKTKPHLPPVQIAKREADCAIEPDSEEPVIVHTCQPCVPAICATELEGVSVYQMTLGSFMILRRIDTDFVNISPIHDFLGLPHPPLDIDNAVTVCQGSSIVCGTWVPSPTARDMIGDQPLVNVFLSDQLSERFPPALQDFYRSNTQGRSLGQFGPPFRSTMEARRESNSSFKLELPPREPTTPWDRGGISPWDVEDHLLSVHPPFALAGAIRPQPLPSPEDDILTETPLSPKEEEIFDSLCCAPEWETTSSAVPPAETAAVDLDHSDQPHSSPDGMEPPASPPNKKPRETTRRDRPLRRSKRVADAAANRSRTRSRRDSRSSLS